MPKILLERFQNFPKVKEGHGLLAKKNFNCFFKLVKNIRTAISKANTIAKLKKDTVKNKDFGSDKPSFKPKVDMKMLNLDPTEYNLEAKAEMTKDPARGLLLAAHHI